MEKRKTYHYSLFLPRLKVMRKLIKLLGVTQIYSFMNQHLYTNRRQFYYYLWMSSRAIYELTHILNERTKREIYDSFDTILSVYGIRAHISHTRKIKTLFRLRIMKCICWLIMNRSCWLYVEIESSTISLGSLWAHVWSTYACCVSGENPTNGHRWFSHAFSLNKKIFMIKPMRFPLLECCPSVRTEQLTIKSQKK